MASPSRRPQTPTVTRIQSGHKDRMKSELRSSVPPPSAQFVFLCGGASGKSAKRRRWRKKRAGFEEVPRLAATTVDGNRLARRWAIAAPYGCMAGKFGAGEGIRIAASLCARNDSFWRCGGYRAGRAFALAFLAFSILFSAKNPPLRGQGRVFFYAGGVRYRALTVFSLPPLKQAPMLSMTTNRPRYHATSHLWE